MRFLPLRRIPGAGQPLNSQGLPVPWVPLPPQRFARSRGFTPPFTCRPYFMPVPPMGFLPSGSYDVRRAIRSFELLYPLVVFELLSAPCQIGLESVSFPRSPTFSSRSLIDTASSEPVPLQGVPPCGRLLFPPELFVLSGSSRPSWASSSLGVLSSCRRVFLGTRPLLSFSPLAPAASALQSMPRKKLG